MLMNISHWFLDTSLRTKLLLPVLLITVIIFVLGGLFLQPPLRQGAEQIRSIIKYGFDGENRQTAEMLELNLLAKGKILGDFTAMSSVNPMLESDFVRLLEIHDIVLADEDVVNAWITDKDGKVIVGKAGDGDARSIQQSYDIDFEGEHLGTVQLALGRESVEKAITASESRIAEVLSSIFDRQRQLIINILLKTILVLLVLIIAYIGSTFLLIEFLTLRPMRQTEILIDELAGGNGDLTNRLPITSQDEVGSLRAAVNRFIELLRMMMLKVQEESQNLSVTTVQLSKLSHSLIDSFTEVNQQEMRVQELIHSVSSQIQNMASTAEQISVNTSSVSSSSEEMSANVSEVSIILDQLNEGVTTISDSAENGSLVVADALESSTRAKSSMHGLDVAALEIDHVTEMIKRVAEQTNLLALNATIEAASAGEHGKGFAVVAKEIKELAGQSSRSAEDIAGRIAEMQGTTRESVEVIHAIIDIIQQLADAVAMIHQEIQTTSSMSMEITANMGETASGISSISEAIAEIAKGNNELSEGVSSAAGSTQQVVDSVRQVNKIIDQTHVIASNVDKASKATEDVVAELDILVRQFKLS